MRTHFRRAVILAALLALPALVLTQSGIQVSDRAKQLHDRAIVIDSHDDTTQRLVDDKTFRIEARNPNGNIDIPRMREGGLDALFFSIWVPSEVTGPTAVKRALDAIETSLSPDGSRLAVTMRAALDDIWVCDTSRCTFTRLTFALGNNWAPVWTPDGRRVVFGSTRSDGVLNLYWKSADGTGVEERLTTAAATQVPTSITLTGGRSHFRKLTRRMDLICACYRWPIELRLHFSKLNSTNVRRCFLRTDARSRTRRTKAGAMKFTSDLFLVRARGQLFRSAVVATHAGDVTDASCSIAMETR
jgi:hypothetical protein